LGLPIALGSLGIEESWFIFFFSKIGFIVRITFILVKLNNLYFNVCYPAWATQLFKKDGAGIIISTWENPSWERVSDLLKVTGHLVIRRDGNLECVAPYLAFCFCQRPALWCFVLFSFETRSHYVALAGLELVILLPQPPQCLDYKWITPCFAFWYVR
jgi:hypothetical protein